MVNSRFTSYGPAVLAATIIGLCILFVSRAQGVAPRAQPPGEAASMVYAEGYVYVLEDGMLYKVQSNKNLTWAAKPIHVATGR
jgi:hypothetical protein